MLELQTSNTDMGCPVSSCGWLLLDVPEGKSLRTHAIQTLSYAQRVGYLTRKAGRHLPIRASCLCQSLLVWWFLRRRGLGVKLRIGVNNREEFLSHAWVELEGRPVNDRPSVTEGFHPFDRIP